MVAYVHYEDNGSLACGIEKAYLNKEISFNKPISCHLYPVRVKEYSEFTAVNYHNWFICSDACSLGNELKKPVYEFVKEALIKKFGNKAEVTEVGQVLSVGDGIDSSKNRKTSMSFCNVIN